MSLRFVLKGKELLERSGVKNAHQVALKTTASYPTIDRYINRPEEVKDFDSRTLASFFCKGLDLTPEQVLAMPLGEFFEIVEEE